jgi:CubicO group peptidase (beta-lactamase class C family)
MFQTLVVVIGLLSSVASAQVTSQPDIKEIDAAMERFVAAHEVAGAVTLVATKDTVVHLGATGFSSLEDQRRMPVDAVFWLASTTKAFTAVAVLMLQDDGKLNIDDPVAKYLPQFANLTTPSGKPAELTIRHLLTHTSGLADNERNDYGLSWNLAGLVQRAVKRPMLFEPGTQCRYNSAEINIAGRIVEVISGQSFDEFLAVWLLRPLQMTDTNFYPPGAQQKRFAACYARSRQNGALYRKDPMNGRVGPIKLPVMPAGGLFSTAHDLGRFGQMLLRHGEFDGHRYLSEASYRLMTTLQTGNLTTGPRGFGLGVYVVRAQAEGMSAFLSVGSFGHPGAWGTHLMIDPVKERVYVLLVQRPNLPDNFDNEPTCALLKAANTALDH